MSSYTRGCYVPRKSWVSRARPCTPSCLLIAIVGLNGFGVDPAPAAEVKTLFAFDPFPRIGGQPTPAYPNGTLLRDANGALYGTTTSAGDYDSKGTVFKLTPPAPGQTEWTMSVLHTFSGGFDGGEPNPNLVMDASGALYGTTRLGGSVMNQGLVFKLTPPTNGSTDWKETVLHYFNYDFFNAYGDGANPSGGLIMDESGALYGTTDLGGNGAAPPYQGFGTVFKLTPLDSAKTNWAEIILYRFNGGNDGQNPMFALTRDSAGALYGTTPYGGTGGCTDFSSGPIGCGAVFKLTADPRQTTWTKMTLFNFPGGSGGWKPQGKLLVDAYGALYGVTYQGGTGTCTDSFSDVIGCGIVFQLTPPGPLHTGWTESVLHDFAGADDGIFPQGGLIADASGALIGTASGGTVGGIGGFGLVFKLTSPALRRGAWTETVLCQFDPSTTGEEPVGELVPDPDGHYFGATFLGGPQLGGSVFEITP